MQGLTSPQNIRMKEPAPQEVEEAPPKKELHTKCFHRFADKAKPGLLDFELLRQIDNGAYGQVYTAKCTTERECEVAIKVVSVKKAEDLKKSSVEIRALELIKATPHENIIEYFGFFDEEGRRYLVFELADLNFKKYLDKALPVISTDQFNEIAFQFLNALDHLNEIQLSHNDYKLRNMVFCSSDRKIKLIDFERSTVPSDKHFHNPLDSLPYTGLYLGEIELLMLHQAENKEFYSAIEMFRDAWRKKNFSRHDALNLEKEEKLWFHKLSDKARNLTALCFVRDEAVHLQVINDRHSLLPRKPLMLIDELNT